MITKAKLVNWRSHLDSGIEFSSGTNVLTGIMGSGKSSIMDAICFGLFGTFPNLQTKKLKLDDIIMSKPHMKDKAEIIISFTLNGEEYSIFRAIERGKGTTYAELRKGETLLEAPQSQRVTEQVQELLKIDYDLFSKAIYSEQNGLDYFLRLSPGERMKKIDNLLMIDRYEKARSSAVTLKNRINDRKLSIQNLVEQINLKELESEISDINSNLREIENNKKLLSKEFEDLKKKSIELEKQVKELEKIEKEMNELKQQKGSIETSMKENEESITDIKNLLKGRGPKEIESIFFEMKERVLKHEKELENYNEQYQDLTSSLSEYSAKVKYLEQEIKNLQTEIQKKTESKKKLKELQLKHGANPPQILGAERKSLEKINHELAVLESNKNELTNLIFQVEELKDECPICKSKISGDKKKHLIEERRNKIVELEKRTKENEIEKKKFDGRIKLLEEVVEEFKSLSFEIKNLETLEKDLNESEKSSRETKIKLSEIDNQSGVIKKKISELHDILQKTRPELSDLEIAYSRVSELRTREEKIIKFKKELDAIIKQISLFLSKLKESDIKELSKSYEENIGRRSELKTKLDSISEIISEKNKRKKELEEQLNHAKKQLSEINKLEELVRNLAIFEKALENTQVQLREEFISTVNHTMNEIWPDIYPYTDFSAIKLAIEGGDYVLQLQTRDGSWVDVEGIASGGERSISALTLRIAFALVLAPQLKWLILDEPTANLDSKAIDDLAETLRTRVGNFVSQIFLITHDRSLENAVTGELYRLKRDKETDGVTIVERVTEL